MKNYKICPDCGVKIGNPACNFQKHLNSKKCLANQKMNKVFVDEKWLLPNGKYKCPDCGYEISKHCIRKHIGSKACLKNQQNKKTLKIQEEWKQTNGKYRCPYCDKEFSKNGIASHIWRMHGEGKDFNPNIGYENGTRIVWNKGVTAKDNPKLKPSIETRKKLSIIAKNRKHSEETKQKLSQHAKKNS